MSTIVQGGVYLASVTALGKIRTSDGLTFTYPSQWLATLSDGTTVKKRKAYETVGGAAKGSC